MITAGELLHGSDEDFVINIYLAVLGRWPDEGGFEHHLRAIQGNPARRLEMLHLMTQSEEARQRPGSIDTDATPVPVEQALAAQLRLRTEVLGAELAILRERAPSIAATLSGEVAALGLEITQLGQELRARLTALEAILAGQLPPSPSLSPALSIDFVNGQIEAAQAPLLHRLRALEKRVLE